MFSNKTWCSHSYSICHSFCCQSLLLRLTLLTLPTPTLPHRINWAFCFHAGKYVITSFILCFNMARHRHWDVFTIANKQSLPNVCLCYPTASKLKPLRPDLRATIRMSEEFYKNMLRKQNWVEQINLCPQTPSCCRQAKERLRTDCFILSF